MRMSNRSQYFVRRISQNSNLNREKFLFNKNNYMVNSIMRKNSNTNYMVNSIMRKNSNTNYNFVKKRNFHTTHQKFGGGGSPGGGPNMLFVAIGGAISIYIIKFKFSKK